MKKSTIAIIAAGAVIAVGSMLAIRAIMTAGVGGPWWYYFRWQAKQEPWLAESKPAKPQPEKQA